jgi:hypothetical protein
MNARQRVLADHKRKGKILVPPFTHMLGGPPFEVSWIKTILPELLWIALIHNLHGDRRAVEIITAFSRLVRGINLGSNNKWLAAISHYSSLSNASYKELRIELKKRELLAPMCAALQPLIDWYPECPFSALFPEVRKSSARKSTSIMPFKESVSALYRRSARGAMMAQATAVWLAFDGDILKVGVNVSLARFPEIQNYPDTDISERIGASIRSTLNAFFGSEIHYSNEFTWPGYFWNRGIAIDACDFGK